MPTRKQSGPKPLKGESQLSERSRLRAKASTLGDLGATMPQPKTPTRLGDSQRRVHAPRGRLAPREPLDQVDDPVRVAPLVVVPGDDLARSRRRSAAVSWRVEDRRVRVADDVGRDQRLLAVLEDARAAARAAAARMRGVDLGGARRAAAAGTRGRRSSRRAPAPASPCRRACPSSARQHLADRARGAGGGRDDVLGGGAAAAQVLVRHVGEALVVGVGVHRGHEAVLDAERARRAPWRSAPGSWSCTRRSRRCGARAQSSSSLTPSTIVASISSLAGTVRMTCLRAGGEVLLERLAGAEDAGRLDRRRRTPRSPHGIARRVALGGHADLPAVDVEDVVVGRAPPRRSCP